MALRDSSTRGRVINRFIARLSLKFYITSPYSNIELLGVEVLYIRRQHLV